MKLNKKVALITGSAKRVGKALALGLAKEGCNIIIHYGRSEEEAAETVAEIEALGVEGWAFSADLGDEAALKTVISRALELAGRLDILVNNASIFPPEDFLNATPESWDSNMTVNLKAPFLLSQAFAQHLPEDRQGKIINLLDSDSLRPKNHHFSYTISKYGLEGLTKATAYALAKRNIQVNGIALGAILANVNLQHTDAAKFEKLAKRIPMGRTGDPKGVVKALIYLVKDADYITGEVIRVDGGWHLA